MDQPAYAFMCSSQPPANTQCDTVGPDRHCRRGSGGSSAAIVATPDSREDATDDHRYSFSLAQLAQILSALENERRNPNTKRNAIKAIERNAAQIGLSAEDVFDAADGLLSGRLSAAEFRAAAARRGVRARQLHDRGAGRTSAG